MSGGYHAWSKFNAHRWSNLNARRHALDKLVDQYQQESEASTDTLRLLQWCALLAALGLLGWGVVRTWRGVRVSNAEIGPRRGSNKFAFVVGAAAGLAAILAHSVVDFNMHIPTIRSAFCRMVSSCSWK